MSYLIQNIIRVNYTLRLNLRIRAMFLYRNYLTIHFLIFPFVGSRNLSSTAFQNLFFWLEIGKYMFARFSKIVCLSTKYLKQVTFGINFPGSAHYLCVYYINNFLFKSKVGNLMLVDSHYLYNMPIPIITAPHATKQLKYFVYQILQNWLNVWIQWSELHSLIHSFICLPLRWQLLCFTNVFYLKVYNT